METKRARAQKAVLNKINYNVAGIDLSSEDMFIAVINKNVCQFSTFTKGLEDAAIYLKSERIEKIVMEATGVYIKILLTVKKGRLVTFGL